MDADTFLTTAAAAERLISEPAVARHWGRPSALEGYTVGGLAGHLSRAVLTVARYLDEPVPEAEVTDAAGYLQRVLGSHDPVSSDFHARVRQRGEHEGASGPRELAARLHEARADLAGRLGTIDARRHVAVLEGTVLPIEEYLATRLVELVLHVDDLAVSIGEDGARDVPLDAYETVAAVLARAAVHRVGPLATVRSLARRERHPEAVRAL